MLLNSEDTNMSMNASGSSSFPTMLTGHREAASPRGRYRVPNKGDSREEVLSSRDGGERFLGVT